MPSVSRVGGAVAVRTAPRTPPSTRNEAVRRAGAVRPAAKAPPAAKIHPAAKVLAAGLAVGFLTGFFGVGGGFVVVPALVMVLGYPMPAAVGTSLLVIAVNSAAALTARVGHASLHWSLLIPFGAAALIGSLAGRPIADRVPAAALSKAFTVLLFAVAGYVAIRAGLGLSG